MSIKKILLVILAVVVAYIILKFWPILLFIMVVAIVYLTLKSINFKKSTSKSPYEE